MSAPTTSASSIADKNLDAAAAAVHAEIGRTDGKASLLLAFNGAALAGLASLTDMPLPTPARVLGGMAVTAIGWATVLLLLVVRPRLSGQDRASFPHWARLTEAEIYASMTSDTRAASIRILSVIAVAKFTTLRRAIDCTLAALAFLAAAVFGALT
ncbi:Pycsar system effector family protein [Streptomyces sp. NPDC006309]|uniref:Pycsar system effector family protein n=1 Tax=Streptomyces sp. NPDC006309 TaxID=3156749 RepID=UPI0033B61888